MCIDINRAWGLVRRRIDGRTHYCSLRPEALAGALDWIAIHRNFWNQRLDTLAVNVQGAAARRSSFAALVG